MKKIMREPLFHFLLIGMLLFLVYEVVNTDQNESEILIDDNLITELVAKWELKRNRKPSLQELTGLIEEYIQQEVLYREALAMNLDHNDEIVKRRLAQKMEFFSDDLAESLQPSDQLLLNYYEENKENYKKPSIFTLQQVYFSNDKRSNAFDDAKRALNNENPSALGDQTLLPLQYIDTDALKISRDFGTKFTSALDTLSTGEWTGPFNSALGSHIVYISKRIPAGYFPFNEVEDRVNIDYNYKASIDFKKEFITSLLKNYTLNLKLEDKELKMELNEKF